MTTEMTNSGETTPIAASAAPAEAMSDADFVAGLRRAVPGFVVLGIVFVFLFWDFLARQVEWAIRHQADWGHTLIIPFISAYFVWVLRTRLTATPWRTTWIGILPVILGVGWYSACVFGPPVMQHHNLMAAGVACTITGLVLLFAGWRVLFLLWFPLAYLFVFGQTISDRLMQIVTHQLQDWTAYGAWILLEVMQYDVIREQNVLRMIHNGEVVPLNVAEACSGMRMLMSMLALGAAMAFTGLRYNWQRIALVALGVPVAIVVNTFRVVTLALIAIVNPDFAQGEFHSFIGLVWLVPAFLIYLGVMWVIRKLVVSEEAA